MSSNYNGDHPAPRPSSSGDGEARVIRRRETVDDLLDLETGYLGSQETSTT